MTELEIVRKAHPAPYSPQIVEAFAGILAGRHAHTSLTGPRQYKLELLDPFAGIGRIFWLIDRYGLDLDIRAIELEPHWPDIDPRVEQGNALHLDERCYDGFATSPCYGNRFADRLDFAGPRERRNSYQFNYGEELHEDNAGVMQWGRAYRRFHFAVWIEVLSRMRDGAIGLLNISDHYRDKRVMPVADWHATTLEGLGTRCVARLQIPTKRMRAGANHELRVPYEEVQVHIFDAARYEGRHEKGQS